MKNIKAFKEYIEYNDDICFLDYLKKYDLNKTLTNIHCSDENLLDLVGINQFDELLAIYCSGNKLSSLKGIEGLINLVSLDCDNNAITSLDFVESLINLNFIYCTYNLITSLEPIKNLKNLMSLRIGHNEITSLKGIENLNKLEILYCDNNPIDWIDYVDKQGNTWYTVLPKSITMLYSKKFKTIEKYWEFMDENQPAIVSRKFNF